MKVKLFYEKFLRSTNYSVAAIKAACVLLLVISGMLFRPLFIAAFFLLSLFIVLEYNVNSLYLVVFFLPFLNAFTFKNDYSLSYWNIAAALFALTLSIKTIISYLKQNQKFNYKILLPFTIFLVYAAIPFNGYFSFTYYGKTVVWISLFYFIIENRKSLDLKKSVLFFIFGIIVAFLIGLLKPFIPYLNNNIMTYQALGKLRYAALFESPNMLYGMCLFGMAFIHILTFYDKLSKWWLFLILPLATIGILTLSKSFLICFAALVFLIAINYLIKFNKKNLIKICIILVSILFATLIAFPYTKLTIERIFPKNETTSITENSNSNETNENNASQDNFDELTTGRSNIWKAYLKDYTSSPQKIIFGAGGGLGNNPEISEYATHNTYIQIIYEYGIVGTLLILLGSIWLLIQFKFFKQKHFPWAIISFVMMGMNFMVETLFLSQIWVFEIILASGLLFLNKETTTTPENATK